MNSQNTRTVYWLPGPLIAVALVLFSVLGRAGPGFFLWSVFAGALFLVAGPLLQLMLLSSAKFRGRYRAACGVVMAAIGTFSLLALFSGYFSFW